jgi:hypothetical protein
MPATEFPAISVPYIADLRNIDPYAGGNTQTTVIVQRYQSGSDGGGGTFFFRDFSPSDSLTPVNDNGIFISSNIPAVREIGIWVRLFSGYIDMRFYGIYDGYSPPPSGNPIDPQSTTEKIQAAINYAAKSNENINTRIKEHNNSNTVYLPNGSHLVTKLIMKSGVHLLGASMINTQIKSINTDDPFLIMLEYNTVTRNICIENIKFEGNAPDIKMSDFEDKKLKEDKVKGCFGFIVPRSCCPTEDYPTHCEDTEEEEIITGGLWESTFKNLKIDNFTGDEIRFECELDEDQWCRTNQWITMENVQAESAGQLAAICPGWENEHHALSITGNAGQFIFTNCRFDGGPVRTKDMNYDVSGTNVYISSSHVGSPHNAYNIPSPSVITFHTCTVQTGANGFILDSVHNIKIDACWFESLERGVICRGTYHTSKSINILNNMFSYAAGNYGGLPIDTGRVIMAANSQVNVYNNYVIDPSQKEFTAFISTEEAESVQNLGINGYGNYFEPNNNSNYLGNTKKMVKEITVTTNVIDMINARTIYLTNDAQGSIEVNIFNSYNITSDYIYIKSKKGSFKLTEAGNLYLGNKDIDLKEGESLFFIKSDDQYDKDALPPNPPIPQVHYYERYNLVAYLEV